jgi:glycine cleavage system H lipoate-binding protein
MRCPFLKEADVKQCGNSAYRKMIVQTAGGAAPDEKCSSPAYTECLVYRQQARENSAADCCPYLEQKMVEYCAAATMTKFVPSSPTSSSRCKSDSYRYCDLYLGSLPRPAAEDIDAPDELYYSANHMWFDEARDGCWHVGIDGLLAKVMGAVDRVTFVTLGGVERPVAVLTVNGQDFEMVFPNPLAITGANLHLRADPSRLTSDPYTLGWLFEGRQPEGTDRAVDGLMRGPSVFRWMLNDMTRLAEFAGNGTMADGGTPCDMLRQLERDRARRLFHEFFSLARVGSGR